VAALGLSNPQAGMFHLFTHASFKALLFLAAGSVIHCLHHEQNIWHMGGLQKKMPITFWTFLVGTLALIACPPFAGFWSKDEILASASNNIPAFLAIAGVTFLTAFYMSRLFVVAFLGEPRSDLAGHAHESPSVMTAPLVILSIAAGITGFPFIASAFVKLPEHEGSPIGSMLISLIAFLAGVTCGYYLYRDKAKDPVEIPLFENKFYVDEFYRSLIKWTQDLLANISGFVDRWVIDGGFVRGLSGITWGFGFALRFLQTGNLQAYAFLFGTGVVLLLYYILFGTK
jgi:NADH-quinone oxidoreductase subunit L